MKSSRIAFESKAKLLESVKAFELSDEDEAAQINGVDQSSRWPPQDVPPQTLEFAGPADWHTASGEHTTKL